MIRQDLICENCNTVSKDVFFEASLIKDSRLVGWPCTHCGQTNTTIIYWGMAQSGPHVKTITFIGDLWDKRGVLYPGDAGYNDAIKKDSELKKKKNAKR